MPGLTEITHLRSHRHPLGWIRQAGFTSPCKSSFGRVPWVLFRPPEPYLFPAAASCGNQSGGGGAGPGASCGGDLIPTQGVGFPLKAQPVLPPFLSLSLSFPFPNVHQPTPTRAPSTGEAVISAIRRRFISSFSRKRSCVDCWLFARCSAGIDSSAIEHCPRRVYIGCVDATCPDRLGSPSPTRLDCKLTAPLLILLGLCSLVIQQLFRSLAPNYCCLIDCSYANSSSSSIICITDLTDIQQSPNSCFRPGNYAFWHCLRTGHIIIVEDHTLANFAVHFHHHD